MLKNEKQNWNYKERIVENESVDGNKSDNEKEKT